MQKFLYNEEGYQKWVRGGQKKGEWEMFEREKKKLQKEKKEKRSLVHKII